MFDRADARRFRRAALLLAFAPLALASAGPAMAHAIVVDSQPPTGATVEPGPVNVVIRYNSRIDFGRSRLSLVSDVDAQGKGKETTLNLREDGSPAVIGATTAPLDPGSYRLRWQVLAVDGHITRGDILFTVAKGAAAPGAQGAAAPGQAAGGQVAGAEAAGAQSAMGQGAATSSVAGTPSAAQPAH